MFCAMPHSSEETAKITAAHRKTRLRPYRSLILPASGITTTWARLYAVIVHAPQVIGACSSSWIGFSAVETIVASSDAIARATATMAKTRCRPGWGSSDPRASGEGAHVDEATYLDTALNVACQQADK